MKLLYIPISAFLLLHATSTLVTSNSSRPRAHELSHDYSFEQYIVDFDKEYKYQSYTHEEYEIKRQIFQRNLEIILNHNKDVGYNLETGVSDGGDSSGHTFHMGVNHLSDLSKDEMQSYFGYDKSLHASYRTGATATSRRKLSKLTTNDHEMDLPFNITDVSTLPPFIKYNNTTPVKNQGQCGSCWAFSSIASLETHLAIQTGVLNVLSTQELVSCVDNPNHCGGSGGCDGATAELAYDYVATNGVLKEKSFPYKMNDKVTCPLTKDDDDDDDDDGDNNSFNNMLRHGKEKKKSAVVAKIKGYARTPSNDYKGLMNAVAKYGTVVIGAAASTWFLYEGGVFSPPKDSSDSWNLNHGIVVEGYGTDETTGEDYWLVRNSWSETFGENGYIRLKRVDPDTLDNPDDECGFDETPFDGVDCQLNPDGSDIVPHKVKVCGTNGMLYDPVFAVGGYLV